MTRPGFSWPLTDLRREDVVGHVPDGLNPAHVSVAHSLHFGEHGAHCRVCGLVAFLIDEDPPVKDTSVLSAPLPLSSSIRPTKIQQQGYIHEWLKHDALHSRQLTVGQLVLYKEKDKSDKLFLKM